MITRKQKTGMALIAAVVVLLLLWLTSCSTKKTVTEYIHVHDTLTVHKSDTVRETKVVTDTIRDTKTVTISDTIYRDRGQTTVINERGDTIKQSSWDITKEKSHEKENATHNESHTDSTSYYHNRSDSLQSVIDRMSQKKEIVKTKIQVPWKWVAYILCGLLAVFVLVTRDRK